MEEWRTIPGNTDYAVSNLGRVLSKERVVTNRNGVSAVIRERVLKHHIDGGGYPVVSLRKDRKKTPPVAVHTLIMLAFIGPRPEGLVVCHGDGNPANSILPNLRYGTYVENMNDAKVQGKTTAGERNAMAKLNCEKVREIKRRCFIGEPDKKIALEFGVSRSTVTYIRNGKTWAHV